MPNPKLGTVTNDVAKAVKLAKAGSIQFRVEKNGIVQAGIGKISFTPQQLLDNIRAFMLSLSETKPDEIKTKYISCVHLSSTMGPGIDIEVSSVDPTSSKFMLDPTLIVSNK